MFIRSRLVLQAEPSETMAMEMAKNMMIFLIMVLLHIYSGRVSCLVYYFGMLPNTFNENWCALFTQLPYLQVIRKHP